MAVSRTLTVGTVLYWRNKSTVCSWSSSGDGATPALRGNGRWLFQMFVAFVTAPGSITCEYWIPTTQVCLPSGEVMCDMCLLILHSPALTSILLDRDAGNILLSPYQVTISSFWFPRLHPSMAATPFSFAAEDIWDSLQNTLKLRLLTSFASEPCS